MLGDDGQSLAKAISQVSRAKELCSQRTPVPLSAISPHMNAKGFVASIPDGWPEQKNPLFAAIIASQVRRKKGDGNLISAGDARDLILRSATVDQYTQDLFVLGQRLIGIPAIPLEGQRRQVDSPFQVHGKTTPMLIVLNGDNAFALGLVQLMWALDWIQLGKIPWSGIVENALDLDI